MDSVCSVSLSSLVNHILGAPNFSFEYLLIAPGEARRVFPLIDASMDLVSSLRSVSILSNPFSDWVMVWSAWFSLLLTASVRSGSSNSPMMVAFSICASSSRSVSSCSSSVSSSWDVVRPSTHACTISSLSCLSASCICLVRSSMKRSAYLLCSSYQVSNTLSSGWFPSVLKTAIAFFCRVDPQPCSLRFGDPRMLVRDPSLCCSMYILE